MRISQQECRGILEFVLCFICTEKNELFMKILKRKGKKMKYLKPYFYDKFICTAGDCPDTCCAGWQIMIDEESLERYGREAGEFGRPVSYTHLEA